MTMDKDQFTKIRDSLASLKQDIEREVADFKKQQAEWRAANNRVSDEAAKPGCQTGAPVIQTGFAVCEYRGEQLPSIFLSGPITVSDLCLIGLALCRLEEAADDYVQSSGWSERSTFPSTKNTIKIGEYALNEVRRVRQRAGELKVVIAKVHSEIQARANVYGSPGSPQGDKK